RNGFTRAVARHGDVLRHSDPGTDHAYALYGWRNLGDFGSHLTHLSAFARVRPPRLSRVSTPGERHCDADQSGPWLSSFIRCHESFSLCISVHQDHPHIGTLVAAQQIAHARHFCDALAIPIIIATVRVRVTDRVHTRMASPGELGSRTTHSM